MSSKQRNFALIGLWFLLGANIFAWQYVVRSGGDSVTFFDVGQGDSIFIETKEGYQILIDGGPNRAVLGKLSKQIPFWDNSLDLVILTHPDKDHLAGLIGVLESYKVDTVLWTGVKSETILFENWEKALEAEGAEVIVANAPQRIGSFGEVLYPAAGVQERELNDTSIVTKWTLGDTSFLLPGDITRKIEKKLTSLDIASSILKVPHHGSKTSSSLEFLQAVNPNIAVIQVSERNSYGHPDPNILKRLNDLGISVLQTSQKGDIVFTL